MIITVAGSTGTIGTELVRRLSETGVPVRAVLRDFTRARPLKHVAWLQADLTEDDKLDATLARTDRLFLLTGNQPGFGVRISAESDHSIRSKLTNRFAPNLTTCFGGS